MTLASPVAAARPARRALLAGLVAALGPALLLAGTVGVRADEGPTGTAAGAPPPGAPPGLEAGAPAAKGTSQDLDELIAVVEGEVITRRMIVREIGPRAEDQSEADYERSVRQRVLKRAMTRVMTMKATRFGLEVKPDVLDQQVQDASKFEVEQAREREEARKPGSGKNVTFEKILAERGQSMQEYKDLIAREILVQQYWYILTKGVTGKRQQFDPEPSPKDVDRLYQAHAKEFDQQFGVRLAAFQMRPETLLEDGKLKYDEAVEETRRRMAALLADIRAGKSPEEAARARGLKKNVDYSVKPEGQFVEKGQRGMKLADDWAFDPARRPGDGTVLDGPRGAIVGFAVLDVRPARARTAAEVYPDLYALIRGVRIERFRIQHMLETVSTAQIYPPGLSGEMDAQLRDALKALDEDPIKRDIRLR